MSGQIIDIQKDFVEPLAGKIRTLGSFLELESLESISRDGHANLVKYNPEEIIINEGERDNWVSNLSFERIFGKMIAIQDMPAGITADKNNRTINYVVHKPATAGFIPVGF